MILTLSSKTDLEKLERDVNRNKNSLLDIDYRLRNIESKVADIDSKLESLNSFVKIELGKVNEKNDKLDAANQNLRKLI